MRASRQIKVVFSALLIACMAGSVLLLRGLDRLRSHATLEEVLYIPSPKAIKRLSLGYDGPHAQSFLKILVGQIAGKAGDLQTALAMWSLTNDTAQEKSIRANAAAHLRALQVDEDVSALEAVVVRFRQKNGQFPASVGELVRLGWLRGIPVDPLRHPYKLVADGRVELRDPDDFPFIQKGTPPGYKPPRMPKLLSPD